MILPKVLPTRGVESRDRLDTIGRNSSTVHRIWTGVWSYRLHSSRLVHHSSTLHHLDWGMAKEYTIINSEAIYQSALLCGYGPAYRLNSARLSSFFQGLIRIQGLFWPWMVRTRSLTWNSPDPDSSGYNQFFIRKGM